MLGKTLRGAAVLLVLGTGLSFAAGLPDTTENVVILAQDSVRLGPHSILASGQVVVNNAGGMLTVRPGAGALKDTEIIAATVTVQAPASRKPELFDILTNSFLGEDRATFHDVSPLVGPWPLFSFPSAPVATPGTGNYVVRQRDGEVTLEQGDYGNITVGWNAALNLAGGVYNIKSLTCNSFSHIFASGTTTLNVQRNVHLASFSTFTPAAENVNPRCIVLNVAGPHVRIGLAVVSAVINAPNAAVSLGTGRTSLVGAGYTGNLAGKTVRVGAFSTLQSADPLLSPCP